MSTNQNRTALEDLTRQLSAALQRQRDLEQQLSAAQSEMGKLGFMQLGRKMRLSTEIENLNRKLSTNRQLQANLEAKIADAQAAMTAEPQAEELPAPASADEAAPSAPESAGPAAQPEAAPVGQAAPAPAPQIAKPRPAAPRRPVLRTTALLTDASLPPEEQVRQLLTHLEAYYPEHKLFSVEVLGTKARAQLTALAERFGHASVADFLAAHGWEVIPYTQARALRLGRHTIPGQEPAIIVPKLHSVLARLEHHYPEKVISRSIQHDHKGLAQDVSALSVYLGYESIGAMMTAHGFRYDVPSGGRPAKDVDAVVNALKELYKDGPKPRTIAQIAADHPEYAAVLKTLQNQAPKRFGMSLRKYFAHQDLM